jgi:hypothetical protein
MTKVTYSCKKLQRHSERVRRPKNLRLRSSGALRRAYLEGLAERTSARALNHTVAGKVRKPGKDRTLPANHLGTARRAAVIHADRAPQEIVAGITK